jgi:PSP1 C-terminal conserved region
MTDAEWQWDRKKLTFYFTAEKRVDFRTLVRELASMFRTRIELKQIGVRDEAKRLDGIGRCGRQYCSASWLPELRPVNLGVAKDQRLSLNPSQISGACGRLMCCLRYEHEFYVHSRRKYPKEGKVVKSSRGEEKVVANDIFRERVTLRGVDGEVRTIPLADLRAEMLDAGDPLSGALESAARQVGPPVGRDDIDEPIDLETLVTEEHPVVRAPSTPRPAQSEGAAQSAARTTPMARSTVRDEPRRPAEDIPSSPPPGGGDAAAATGEGEKRTQRRRGRRGGRRNRPGGGNSPSTPDAPPADHSDGE